MGGRAPSAARFPCGTPYATSPLLLSPPPLFLSLFLSHPPTPLLILFYFPLPPSIACMQVMVAAMVFYDRASHGASLFESRELNVKKCIAAVKKLAGPGREALVNSLKCVPPRQSSVLPGPSACFKFKCGGRCMGWQSASGRSVSCCVHSSQLIVLSVLVCIRPSPQVLNVELQQSPRGDSAAAGVRPVVSC